MQSQVENGEEALKTDDGKIGPILGNMSRDSKSPIVPEKSLPQRSLPSSSRFLVIVHIAYSELYNVSHFTRFIYPLAPQPSIMHATIFMREMSIV